MGEGQFFMVLKIFAEILPFHLLVLLLAAKVQVYFNFTYV